MAVNHQKCVVSLGQELVDQFFSVKLRTLNCDIHLEGSQTSSIASLLRSFIPLGKANQLYFFWVVNFSGYDEKLVGG
jgi:hypothetical protein